MTQLRLMSADRLRALDDVAVVRGRLAEPPLAVVVPYEMFMRWQTLIQQSRAVGEEPSQL